MQAPHKQCVQGPLRAALFSVLVQHIGYEDRSWITWAFSARSPLQPFSEDDLSLFAVRRAS
jgi:hypothetical protein